MNGKLITVVVPVYKVEQYIDKCLSSLIVPEKQLPLLEVIVVNDGTPDRSADMAREYEKRYPEVFRVIDKENGGHGSAWNRGLKEATGKYLRFLDSDDWFDTAEFSRLISRLSSLDADVVISHYNRHYVQTGEIIKHPMYADPIDASFQIEAFDWSKLSWERMNFWGCTYRTGMLQKEYPLFLEGVYYDDAILFAAPLLLADTIHVFDATIYQYLIGRPGQTMSKEVRKKHLRALIKTHMHLFDFCIAHLPEAHPGKALQEYLADFLRVWLFECMRDSAACPYRESKALSKACDERRIVLSSLLPQSDLSCKSFRLYSSLPYPVYFFLMKLRKQPEN